MSVGTLATLRNMRTTPSSGVRLRLTMTELQLFLEGSELVGRVKLSPTPFLQ